MEFDVREIVLSHLQHVARVGEKHVATLYVGSNELVFPLLESLESFFIVAFNPTGFIERNRFPATLGAIFVEQTILYDFELELSDSADNLATIELVDEQLRHALIHELVYTLFELLRFHRVGILNVFEHLWREARQTFEMKFFAGGEGVADFEVAGVRDADNIAGECFVDDVFLLSHEGCWRRKLERLAGTYMQIWRVAFEAT